MRYLCVVVVCTQASRIIERDMLWVMRGKGLPTKRSMNIDWESGKFLNIHGDMGGLLMDRFTATRRQANFERAEDPGRISALLALSDERDAKLEAVADAATRGSMFGKM